MTERPTPDLDDPRDPGLSRRQRLVLRAGDPPRRRPRLAGEVPDQHHPRLHRQPARDAARAARALLLARPPRRLRRAAQRGHLARPRRRAHRAGPPAGRRPRHPPRQDPPGQGRSRATTTSSSGTSTSRSASRPARLAVRLVNHLVQADPEFDWDQELEAFILRAERTAFGPSTQAILDEAVSRDIPWIRLNQYSLVQLGQGVHAKRIRATMTSTTSAIAVDIASDKDLTTRLLGAAGLPVPKQDSVRTADQAVRAAERIGYPVVVKPLDGNHGRGVCLDLQNEADVREAFPIAEEQSRRGVIVVESLIIGKDYRCLIIDGRIAAIAERVPASVTGDGTATVEQLVDTANADPRRGVGHEKVLTRIKVDDAAIELVREQGYEMTDVPPEGADGQARAHRQHVDRRHLDRPHLRGAPGERRDRRGGRPDGRPRHRRHRLHLPRHHRAGPRDRRRDLRGQRGPGLPDAHPPDHRRAAVHRQAGRRHAVPAGRDRRGSRSWPSPAPTARRPPRG